MSLLTQSQLCWWRTPPSVLPWLDGGVIDVHLNLFQWVIVSCCAFWDEALWTFFSWAHKILSWFMLQSLTLWYKAEILLWPLATGGHVHDIHSSTLSFWYTLQSSVQAALKKMIYCLKRVSWNQEKLKKLNKHIRGLVSLECTLNVGFNYA